MKNLNHLINSYDMILSQNQHAVIIKIIIRTIIRIKIIKINNFINMKIIIENSTNYFKKYSEKNNVFKIYDYQNYYLNDFQITVKNYEKLLKKNFNTACYICDTDFLSNNKLY